MIKKTNKAKTKTKQEQQQQIKESNITVMNSFSLCLIFHIAVIR